MLAEKHGGTVINADSAQVYRDLRIVTARPSAEEEARAPHRLFGHVDAADAGYSAARWASEARDAIDAAVAAGSLPILVGGTGLYLRTLIDGIAPVPEIDPAIRAEVRAMPVADAYAALADADPEQAAKLNPTDTTRVARALEVIRSTGRSIAEWRRERVGGIGERIDLRALILLPPREWLVEPRSSPRRSSTCATARPSTAWSRWPRRRSSMRRGSTSRRRATRPTCAPGWSPGASSRRTPTSRPSARAGSWWTSSTR